MYSKEWNAIYQGHKIVVLALQNAWKPSFSLKSLAGEARLYVDGEKVDSATNAFFHANQPVMYGSIKLADNLEQQIEVYIKSNLQVIQTKICVEGLRIGGDDF